MATDNPFGDLEGQRPTFKTHAAKRAGQSGFRRGLLIGLSVPTIALFLCCGGMIWRIESRRTWTADHRPDWLSVRPESELGAHLIDGALAKKTVAEILPGLIVVHDDWWRSKPEEREFTIGLVAHFLKIHGGSSRCAVQLKSNGLTVAIYDCESGDFVPVKP